MRYKFLIWSQFLRRSIQVGSSRLKHIEHRSWANPRSMLTSGERSRANREAAADMPTEVLRDAIVNIPSPPLSPSEGAVVTGVFVNDIHSQLNATRVDRVVAVDSEATLRAAIRPRARKTGGLHRRRTPRHGRPAVRQRRGADRHALHEPRSSRSTLARDRRGRGRHPVAGAGRRPHRDAGGRSRRSGASSRSRPAPTG